MSKKSREKKQRKLERRGSSAGARPIASAQADAPAQRAVQERIRRGGKQYLEDNLIHVLRDSYQLHRESEFRDLYFDLRQTDTVSSRVMRKYEQQLQDVLKKSKDERQQFYDEVRIEIIEELAKPAFRKDVLDRLERLAQRLAGGKDVNKYEIAMLLQPLLQEKEIPWGLCGLVTSIYEASREKAERQFGQALGEFEKILGQAGGEGNLAKFLTLPDSSPEITQAVERLKARPDVLEALRKDADQAFEEFEQQIAQGKVQLDLFDSAEVERPLRALADYVAQNQVDAKSADHSEISRRMVELVQQAIDEVMTPERIQKMKDDLKRLSAEWLREKNWQGILLQGEISLLDSEPPGENAFVYAAYVNQLKRWRDAQVAANPPADEAVQAESESHEVDTAPDRPRGLRERVIGRFGKRKES